MSDITKAFTFLQDTVPQWLQDVTNVEEKVTSMQPEVAKVAVSTSPFAKGKTGSVESIRPEKLDAVAEESTPSNAAPFNPLESRKRKSPSINSGQACETATYRPKMMVVVSYDGDMQKSFELLVRGLATGRNMLRKAKMEAKMAELAALAGSSEDEEDDDNDEEDHIMSKISYRPQIASMRMRVAARRGASRGAFGGAATPPAVLFETTDKTLEQAQELCEKSAHLTLREGDCRTELKLVRMHLQNILSTATSEATKRAMSPPEIRQDQDTSDTSVSSIEPSYKRHFPTISTPKPVAESETKLELVNTQSTIRAPIAAQPMASKTMDIEVDDDDDDEEDFVMPPVRFTSRRAARV